MKEERFMRRIVCCLLAALFLAAPAAGAKAAKKTEPAAHACPACGMEIPRTEYCPRCGTAQEDGGAAVRAQGRERPEDRTEWMTAAAFAEKYGAQIRDGVPDHVPADPLPLTAYIVLDDRSEGTDGSGIGPLTEKGISHELSAILQKCADRIRAESENVIRFTSDPDRADVRITVLQTYPYRGEYTSRSGMRASGYGCRIEITATQLSHPAYTLSTYESHMPPDSVTTSGGGTFWMDPPDIASGTGLKRIAESILRWYGYDASRSTDQKDRNDVLLVQRALAERGFYAGKITGKMDDATKDAVRALQRDCGLQETGWIGRATLLALYFNEAAYRSYALSYLLDRTEQLGRTELCCAGCGKLWKASDGYAYCARCGTALPEYPSEGLRTADGQRIPEEAAATVGDVVLFGRYEQDNDRKNGPEPVEWIVIAEEEGNLLLLSRYALTARGYEAEYSAALDTTKNLAGMLREDLPDAVFTAREQACLRYTQTGSNKSNKSRLFSLKAEDAERYLAAGPERLCRPTPFAAARGAGRDAAGNCGWWLAPPDDDWKRNTLVSAAGEVRSSDVNGKDATVGVRPAVWVDPSAQLPAAPGRAETVAVGEAQAGDVVLFGSYEQDTLTSDGREPIEWIVLAREKNRVLLLSRLALDSRAYGWKEGLTWENSDMRVWLNGTFAGRAFTAEEKGRILALKLKTAKNSAYGTKGGKDTKDLVFLLSEDELKKYLRSAEERMCLTSESALENGAKPDAETGSVDWWLRTPGEMQGSQVYVGRDGRAQLRGESAMNHGNGVRPAVWIRID